MDVIEQSDDGDDTATIQFLDHLTDFALLPDHINELGQRLQRERDALLAAATEMSDAWDAWMENEDGEGQERAEDAIGTLRAVLRAVAGGSSHE